jgi:hypothetical protein
MHGRSCSCLLVFFISTVFLSAVLVSILTPASLFAQSDRAHVEPDFSLPPSLPYPDQPPIEGPSRPTPARPLGGIPPRFLITPPGRIGLPQIVQAAGSIFSGVVTAVASRPASLVGGHGQPVGTVAITFHVERAIRGALPGSELVISEWMGAWSGGQQYRVGDRALLFFYPASKLGLTSCVGGAIGRFRIDPTGHILLNAQQLSIFRADPQLRGKSLISFQDFALAVERAGGAESTP